MTIMAWNKFADDFVGQWLSPKNTEICEVETTLWIANLTPKKLQGLGRYIRNLMGARVTTILVDTFAGTKRSLWKT